MRILSVASCLSLALLLSAVANSAPISTFVAEAGDPTYFTGNNDPGDGQIIIVIGRGIRGIYEQDFQEKIDRAVKNTSGNGGWGDACISFPDQAAEDKSACAAGWPGHSGPDSSFAHMTNENGQQIYAQEYDESVPLPSSWHEDLVALIAAEVAPKAEFVFIQAGHFTSGDEFELYPGEVEAALDHIVTKLLWVYFDPRDVTVVYSYGTVQWSTLCPFPGAEAYEDVIETMNWLNTFGVSIVVAAGSRRLGAPNVEGVAVPACAFSNYAVSGYRISPDLERDSRTANGYLVDVVARSYRLDVNLYGRYSYSALRGSSFSAPIFAGQLATMKSSPDYSQLGFTPKGRLHHQLASINANDNIPREPGSPSPRPWYPRHNFDNDRDYINAALQNDGVGDTEQLNPPLWLCAPNNTHWYRHRAEPDTSSPYFSLYGTFVTWEQWDWVGLSWEVYDAVYFPESAPPYVDIFVFPDAQIGQGDRIIMKTAWGEVTPMPSDFGFYTPWVPCE